MLLTHAVTLVKSGLFEGRETDIRFCRTLLNAENVSTTFYTDMRRGYQAPLVRALVENIIKFWLSFFFNFIVLLKLQFVKIVNFSLTDWLLSLQSNSISFVRYEFLSILCLCLPDRSVRVSFASRRHLTSDYSKISLAKKMAFSNESVSFQRINCELNTQNLRYVSFGLTSVGTRLGLVK